MENERCEKYFFQYLMTLHNTNKLANIYERVYDSTAPEPTLKSLFTFWRNLVEPRFDVPDMANSTNPKMSNFSDKLVLNGQQRLVASERIEPGEILLMEKAILISAAPNEAIPGGTQTCYRCYHCRRLVEHFVTCVGCDIVVFCSYNCRYFSWTEYHQWECYGLQRGLFNSQDATYIAMRTTLFGLQFEDGTASQAYYTNHYNFKHFWNMPFDDQKTSTLLCNTMLKCLQHMLYLNAFTTFFDWLSTLTNFKDMNKFEQLVHIGGRMLRHYLQAEGNAINLPHCHDQVYFQSLDSTCLGLFTSLQFFSVRDHPNSQWFVRENYIIIKAARVILPNQMITIRRTTDEHHMCTCDKCLVKLKCNTFACFTPKCGGNVWPVNQLDYTYLASFKKTKTLSHADDLAELQCNLCSAKFTLQRYKILLANAQENIDTYFRTMVGEHLNAANAIYRTTLNGDHLLYAGLYSLIVQAVFDNRGKNWPLSILQMQDMVCYYAVQMNILVDRHYGTHSRNHLMTNIFTLKNLTIMASYEKDKRPYKATCTSISQKVGTRAEFFCYFKASEFLHLADQWKPED